MRALSCLAAVLFCWGFGRESLAATRYIDYLYVEANEGDSSGGHAAIRFVKQTYHFQHDSTGIIRVRRLDSAAFDHGYAILGNRTIRESRIAVSDETYALLRDGFARFVVIQEAQLAILDALRRDVALFELLLAQGRDRSGGAAASGLPLKGLGYFLPDGPTLSGAAPISGAGDTVGAVPPSPALMRLRDRIRATCGERFAEERITRIRARLHENDLRAAPLPAAALSRDSYPLYAPSASTNYDDDLLALFALKVLQSAPKLRPGTFWTSESAPFRLTPGEELFLGAYAGQLESDLVRLVTSSRRDWGFPFIAGMARLASVEASLASGRLVVLDLFPDAAQARDRLHPGERSYLPALKNRLEKVFLQRRKEFFEHTETRESDYTALEGIGNQLLELERAMAGNTRPRRSPESPLPSRMARRNDLVLPAMDDTALARELERARSAERDYARAMSSLYAYDLIRRNCVTEIFASINGTFERLALAKGKAGQAAARDSAQTAREESLHRLGGFVDASRGFTFIPFVSAGTVDACYSVVDRHERPSYRAGRLAEMKQRESPFLVSLRESNTITSTLYRPTPEDSPFLFFTDDTILLRPLFGAFNLLVGLGESLLGVATMPVDGAQRLRLGVKGVLFSLPELAFVNIRKGSMEFVEEAQ